MTNQSEYITYFNGEWLPHGQVSISPDDRGFTLSDVVYDIARTFDGKPFRLQDHIDRLYRSMRYLRIDSGIAAEDMMEICREVVRRNEPSRPQVGDFTINPFVTRGPSLDGPPTVCVRVKPVAFATFARAYVEGAQALIATARSYSTDSMEPKVKHHSRLNMVLAELGWRAPDYDEAAASAYMKNAELRIGVDLGLGQGARTVWTCDLTHGYIDINADYRS